MVVHPVSHGISRVPRYSGSRLPVFSFGYGALTRYGRPSHAVLLDTSGLDVCPQPRRINPPVWPPPRSLATTCGISVDVFSSPYLDVSVQAVPLLHLFDSMQDPTVLPWGVSPFGNLRINGYLLLPAAYRSLSRPSSAPDAKAFPLRSFQLDLFEQSSDWFSKFLNYAGILLSFEIVIVTLIFSDVVPQLNYLASSALSRERPLCCLASFY